MSPPKKKNKKVDSANPGGGSLAFDKSSSRDVASSGVKKHYRERKSMLEVSGVSKEGGGKNEPLLSPGCSSLNSRVGRPASRGKNRRRFLVAGSEKRSCLKDRGSTWGVESDSRPKKS